MSIFFQKANPCNKFKQLTYVDTELSFFQVRSRSKPPRGQVAQVVMLIREVYKRRNPAKLGEVKRLLEKYKATRQHCSSTCNMNMDGLKDSESLPFAMAAGARGSAVSECVQKVWRKAEAIRMASCKSYHAHTHTHMLKVSYLPPAHVWTRLPSVRRGHVGPWDTLSLWRFMTIKLPSVLNPKSEDSDDSGQEEGHRWEINETAFRKLGEHISGCFRQWACFGAWHGFQ